MVFSLSRSLDRSGDPQRRMGGGGGWEWLLQDLTQSSYSPQRSAYEAGRKTCRLLGYSGSSRRGARAFGPPAVMRARAELPMLSESERSRLFIRVFSAPLLFRENFLLACC